MKFKRVTKEVRTILKKERVSQYHSEDGRLKIVPYFTSRSGVRMYHAGKPRHCQVREKSFNILIDGRPVRYQYRLWRLKDAKEEAERLVCPECKDYGMRDAGARRDKNEVRYWLKRCKSCGHEIREEYGDFPDPVPGG